MGTNFYMMTKNKQLAEQYAPYGHELTDSPDWGYEIHLAKTSCGWLPLFQAYRHGIRSVAEIKEAYDIGEFAIYDEYNDVYTWEEFEDGVLKFNGGVRGVQKIERVADPDGSECNIPISHIPGNEQSYKHYYSPYDDCKSMFVDDEGYEFEEVIFS